MLEDTKQNDMTLSQLKSKYDCVKSYSRLCIYLLDKKTGKYWGHISGTDLVDGYKEKDFKINHDLKPNDTEEIRKYAK